MIRHLIRMVWNRKRTNALIIFEIFAAFLVLAVTLTFAFYFAQSYRRPLGYEWKDVWRVSIDIGQASDDTWSEETVNRFAQLLVEVKRMPEVESVAGIQYPPYTEGSSSWSAPGQPEFHRNEVTDDVFEVLQIDLVEGRAFNATDDALAWTPVIIDRDMAKAAFGSGSPIGKRFDPTRPPGAPEPEDIRVVGVVSDFRKDGELEGPRNYMLRRVKVGDIESRPPRHLVLRMAQGTRNFEPELSRRLAALAPEWSFTIQPLERARDASLRLQLAPLLVALVIAGFLVLMVGLGLTGILWQSVTRRTSEIGLRRAVGASAGSIHTQLVLEMVVLVTIGIVLGVLVVAQLPLLGSRELAFLGPAAIPLGALSSAAVIYVIAALCAIYPSILASRIRPAEALHYE